MQCHVFLLFTNVYTYGEQTMADPYFARIVFSYNLALDVDETSDILKGVDAPVHIGRPLADFGSISMHVPLLRACVSWGLPASPQVPSSFLAIYLFQRRCCRGDPPFYKSRAVGSNPN